MLLHYGNSFALLAGCRQSPAGAHWDNCGRNLGCLQFGLLFPLRALRGDWKIFKTMFSKAINWRCMNLLKALVQ